MIIRLENISKSFPVEQNMFTASPLQTPVLSNINLTIPEYQTTGLVGESGSGKTTLAKIMLKLITPTSGTITYGPRINTIRKDVQIVFQNPYNSLNPRMIIKDVLFEPLIIHKIVPPHSRLQRATELLEMVGLDKSALTRLPKEFSGGQRQRIAIARALACQPLLVILDEPISSLDLTVQAQMLQLFSDLKKRLNLTYVFISHNLAVIKYIADSVVILHDGRIVENARKETIFNNPGNSYTKELLEAAKVKTK